MVMQLGSGTLGGDYTEQMAKNLFTGRHEAPSEKDLAKELGAMKEIWDQLVSAALAQCGNGRTEWNSYSPKAGWSLRVKRGERNIVYLSPCEDCVLALFALGEKAMQEARKADFPVAVRKIVREAKKYAEGTAVRIPVTSVKDIPVVLQLMAVKQAH